MRSGSRTSTRLAGPLLAAIFVQGGWDAVCRPEQKVKLAEPVTRQISSRIDFVPDDPAALIRANGAVQVGAAGLLAAGKVPRFASLALIGSLIPTTYVGHAFWHEIDDERGAQQRVHFLKNLGIMGGLLAVATTPRAKSKSKSGAKATRRSKRCVRKIP